MKGFSAIKRLLALSIVLVLSSSTNVLALEQANATVVRVIDGDTLKVRYKGEEERIWLIGIDTPESGANKKARRDTVGTGDDIQLIISQGKEATSYVKGLVKPEDSIRIEFDVQDRNKYGRLLGYVYLSDGRMLNEEIVRAGYASLAPYDGTTQCKVSGEALEGV
jgi:micrococcal nuclease